MKNKTILKDSLTFSKKQKIGIAVLVTLILMAAFWPAFYTPRARSFPVDTAWLKAANDLQQTMFEKKEYVSAENKNDNFEYDRYDENLEPNTSSSTLFPFDPNTLSADGFKKLGLRERTIQILMNYRSKGGQFRKPDDFQKIYGLKPEEFARLRPYIQIAGIEKIMGENFSKKEYLTNFQEEKPKYKAKIIEINSADSTAYKSLYGIGSKLAARIINFRTKLGGFYSIDQVGETYGVPDSVFQKIKSQLRVNVGDIKKININTAGYEELNNHPYISSKLAYQILKRRKEKGNYTNIEEIKEPLSLTTDSYEKVSKYVSVD